MTQSIGRLPDFIIIGATKAGTTSLDFYLSLHPEIHMARPKEPRFFIDAPEPLGRWHRGLDWYSSLFASDKAICGESSPTYATWPYHKGIIERIHAIVPSAKILFIVRERFARLRSSYLMSVRYRGNEESFMEFLQNKRWALDASMYGAQIQNIISFFPLQQILVLEAEELKDHREATLRSVFRFLAVNPSFHSPLFRHKRHDSRFHMYPNKIGRKILRQSAIRWLEQKLPPAVFYHLRNGLNWVFAGKKPETPLDSEFKNKLLADFLKDTDILRNVTGKSFINL